MQSTHRLKYNVAMIKQDSLRTVHPGQKIGVKMGRSDYEVLKNFILETLDAYSEITVNDLLGHAQLKFANEFRDSTGWHVYQVKLDLEARGIIKHDRANSKQKKSIIKRMNLKPAIKTNDVGNLSEHEIADVYPNVKKKFTELFGTQPMVIHSPGRINLIGEHTDYNNGYVMPAAIDKGIQCAIAPSKSKQSIIYSPKYHQYYSLDLKNIAIVKSPAWANYLLGIIHQMEARGLKVRPFNCVFDGDLPLGAGLSSSAAIECCFAYALNELNDFNLSKLEMIHMAQWAEHNYVGVKCGIMDQFTSIMGQAGHAMVLDCERLTYKYFPLALKEFSLVLCDTNVKHFLASSEYNTRREECEEGVRILQRTFPIIKSLRDVSVEMLARNSELLPEKVSNRCRYIVEENDRVLKGSEDLTKGDLESFGKKMFETHEGLSRLYEVSCPELDFLVEKSKLFSGVIGSRMMGGGFGGCTLNIIQQNRVGEFIYQMKRQYKDQFKIELTTHVVKTGNGTSVIENPSK